MNHVTSIISQELNRDSIVIVHFASGQLEEFLGIKSMGFSTDEDDMLLLFRDEDELPAVIINSRNVNYVEVRNA